MILTASAYLLNQTVAISNCGVKQVSLIFNPSLVPDLLTT